MKVEDEAFLIDRLSEKDAASLSQLMIRNARSFQEFLPNTLAQNLSESASKDYIKTKNKAFDNKNEFTFTIKDKDTQKVAGLIILKNLDWPHKQGEFAYCLGAAYSGHGWMSKSLKAAKTFALDKLGLKHLLILIHHTNTSSINVAKRAGFSWSQTLEKEFISGKSVLDMELYEYKTHK